MAEGTTARSLLREAALRFDVPGNPLAQSSRTAWRCGFVSGGSWMRRALEHLRGQALADTRCNLQRLGLLKYGLCCATACAWLLLTMVCQRPLAALGSVPIFYAVEAQMVFLFPLALDGASRPFREARRWTRRAGGTLTVMRIVLALAATMLLGGFLGRGFVRSWCLGCLAVCIWYERLRRQTDCESAVRTTATLLEFGAFRLPTVRHERFQWHLPRPVRLLYASDLHLGHRWTVRVPEHLLVLARRTRPDIILLGGDLVDSLVALEPLGSLLRSLTAIAPVHAIAGNHDVRAGVAAVRAAVVEAGAHWLTDNAVVDPLRIEGVLASEPFVSASHGPRILCAHAPAVFPDAVRAGYRLVLAGHLHGGQCVLATRRGKQYPAVWLHRWHGLRFQHGDADLLVSRGAADSFPFRFNCPREVLLCEIV